VVPRAQGRRPGKDRQDEFQILSQLAKTQDGALNRVVGDALRAAGLIDAYEAEDVVGVAQKRTTDLLCTSRDASVRLELMWRAQTSVGEIARYVLEKLYQYGKAIGFLNGS